MWDGRLNDLQHGKHVLPTSNASLKKSTFVAVVLAFMAAIAIALPMSIAHAQTDVNVKVPEKIQAIVDEDTGQITFEQATIQNDNANLTAGVNTISTASGNAALAGKTFVIKAEDKEIYNKTIGTEFTPDAWFSLPPAGTSTLTYELNVDAATAKSLIGTSDLTISSTWENLCAISGNAKDQNGAILPEAKVVFYVDDQEWVSETSAEDGSFMLMIYAGMNGYLKIIAPDGSESEPIKFGEGGLSTEKDQALGDVKIRPYAVVPEPISGLVYNDDEQIGVEGGCNITLSGDYKATNAGSYTAKAEPNPGYTWKDGTSTSKNISWSISKAQASITPSETAGTLDAGATGTFTVAYVGESTMTVSSSSTTVANATIEDNTITMTAIAAGKAIITVSSPESSNYKSAETTYALTVNAGPGPTYGDGYAIYDKSADTLTFYCDGKKEERKASFEEGDKDYDVKDGSDPAWKKDTQTGYVVVASKAIFDSSFKNYLGITTMKNWFSESTEAGVVCNISSISGFGNVNVSLVEDMSYMFNGANKLNSIDGIDTWNNTSKVKTMSHMFSTGLMNGNDATEVSPLALDLANLDVSGVEDMSYMFYHFNHRDFSMVYDDNWLPKGLSNWNLASVTNCSHMFDEMGLLSNSSECLDGQTEIAIDGLGNYKKISDLTPGDTYMGVDSSNNISVCTIEKDDIATHNVSSLGSITFSDGSEIKLTTDHQILTESGWKSIKSNNSNTTLVIGDTVCVDNEQKTIVAIRVDDVNDVVTYNIRPNNNSIVGYVTKNCIVENTPSFEVADFNSQYQKTFNKVNDSLSQNTQANWRRTCKANFPDLTGWQLGTDERDVDCSYMFANLGYGRTEKMTWSNVSGIFKNVSNCEGIFSNTGPSDASNAVDFSSSNFNSCNNFEKFFQNSNVVQVKFHDNFIKANDKVSEMFSSYTLTTIFCNSDFSNVSLNEDEGGMFLDAWSLVGENGTSYSEVEHDDHAYAKPDESGSPGYFTTWS